jgi:hypothetical protein
MIRHKHPESLHNPVFRTADLPVNIENSTPTQKLFFKNIYVSGPSSLNESSKKADIFNVGQYNKAFKKIYL